MFIRKVDPFSISSSCIILADNLCKILHDNMDDSYIKPKCLS